MPIAPLSGPLSKIQEDTLRRCYQWIIVDSNGKPSEILTDTIRNLGLKVIPIEEHIQRRQKIVPVFECLELISLLIEMLPEMEQVRRFEQYCGFSKYVDANRNDQDIKQYHDGLCAQIAHLSVGHGLVANNEFWEQLKKIAKVTKRGWRGFNRFTLCRSDMMGRYKEELEKFRSESWAEYIGEGAKIPKLVCSIHGSVVKRGMDWLHCDQCGGTPPATREQDGD